MTALFVLTLLVIPPLGFAFARIMTRASERYRNHMTGWLIMSWLGGGVLGLVWIGTYIGLLNRLAVSLLWLLLPLGLLLGGAIVCVLILRRASGNATKS